MKFALFLIALAHLASCGNVAVRTSSLLSPAGVTYVDGSYHAGLAAGPVAYSASVAPSVYHSAAVAPAVAVATQPSVAVAASPAVAVAPVAYSAPATKYAAVPTVQHVPGVADVPVTRIDAEPAVIQKTVDVARPAVKTQRYEIKRPAIQKQFYDIEERVVVRPAGSAVVELDEPLSRVQKGPSVIRPTGEGVAISSVAAAPAVSAVSPAPAELPSVEINLARSSLGATPAPVVSATPSVDINLARSSVSAAPAPSVDVNFARTAFTSGAPAVAAAPSVDINLARSSLSATAAPVAAPAPAVNINLARSSFSPAPAQIVSSAPAVNVNLARSSFVAPVQTATYSASYAPQQIVSAVPVKTISFSAPVHAATVSGVSSISAGSSGISGVSFSTPAPQYQQEIVQSTPSSDFSDDSVSIDSADFGLARSRQEPRARQNYPAPAPQAYAAPAPAPQAYAAPAPAPQAYAAPAPAPQAYAAPAPAPQAYAAPAPAPQTYAAPAPVAAAPPTPQTIFRSAVPTRRFPAQSASSRGSLIVNYPDSLDLVPQPQFRAASGYSDSVQSEINHGNQQRLIQLLTARGGVTEIGFGRSGGASYPVDAGEVRARVISATPAPAYSAPAGERVNTRRVVVSRPIETLQEVEVAEPVTKYERIQVDQPTVIKTARQGVVRVPTSVPVYGKTLAPIAEAPVAAYSAGWH